MLVDVELEVVAAVALVCDLAAHSYSVCTPSKRTGGLACNPPYPQLGGVLAPRGTRGVIG